MSFVLTRTSVWVGGGGTAGICYEDKSEECEPGGV